jgi:hypothetical protein
MEEHNTSSSAWGAAAVVGLTRRIAISSTLECKVAASLHSGSGSVDAVAAAAAWQRHRCHSH